jgi:site-specific DNA-methyltransferase (cytosine-N4-specific)
MPVEILTGNVLDVGRSLAPASVAAVVTSVPYWGQRDYGHPDQIGLEESPAEYVVRLAEAFDAIVGALRPDGTCWINIGDTFYGDSPVRSVGAEAFSKTWDKTQTRSRGGQRRVAARVDDLSLKDEVGIPWLLVRELRRRGWRGPRPEIIWNKPAVKPSGRTTDRVALGHESLLVMTRARHYRFFLDHLPAAFRSSVWTLPVASVSDHPAPMPARLAELAILAATEPGDLILDPFVGGGTVTSAAVRLGRRGLGIELVERFAEMARKQADTTSLAMFA